MLRYLFDSNEDRADIDLSAYQAVFERHSEMDPNVLMQAGKRGGPDWAAPGNHLWKNAGDGRPVRESESF